MSDNTRIWHSGCGPLGGMRYAGSRLILTDAGRRVLEGGET